ncbi:MAG: phosphate ABC transporter substrate-binding protein PstS [Chloroflexi bacterium]|nr:phosphate ABC transporter substrate-binding protein PstS [Chloroflexota bacterium]
MTTDRPETTSRRSMVARLSATFAGGAFLAACGAEAEPAKAPAAPTAAAKAEPTKAPAAAPTTAAAAPPTAPAPAASGAVAITGPFEGEAKTLTGAGATFPAALYSKYFNEYNKLAKVEVNYQSIGSGGGIKAISDQTADFGATDSPMTDAQLKEAKGGAILHIPMALGAVVATYNIPGLETTKLKFTGETLAAIFLGTITKWNDPKIAADNAGVKLPTEDIVSVHRSDGSGTSFVFTDYLSAVSAEWKTKVGASTTVNWPGGVGGKGNEGVAGEVRQTPFSIGYVELIYAVQNKLGVGLIKNKAGQFVEPNLAGVTGAAAAAAGKVAPDLRVSIVDQDGAETYPISSFTWILAYKQMADAAKATALTRLLWWGTHEAQKFNGDLGYAPLPAEIVTKGEAMIKSITGAGKPAFPGK